jgi:hypothetical protein
VEKGDVGGIQRSSGVVRDNVWRRLSPKKLRREGLWCCDVHSTKLARACPCYDMMAGRSRYDTVRTTALRMDVRTVLVRYRPCAMRRLRTLQTNQHRRCVVERGEPSLSAGYCTFSQTAMQAAERYCQRIDNSTRWLLARRLGPCRSVSTHCGNID